MNAPAPAPDIAASVRWLRSTDAIRQRCGLLHAAARRGELRHFRLHAGRLDRTAAYVAEVIRESYPRYDIPYHSRWRHFDVGGIDRWGALSRAIDPGDLPRAAADLAGVSVLLDAGAGPGWGYSEAGSGARLGRSEGLAVASLAMFRGGLFSGDPARPFRTDAPGLEALTEATLSHGFQVNAANPLVGLAARVELLRRLGAALRARPDVFGRDARFGNLVPYLTRDGTRPMVPARELLDVLLETLGPIWPSGLMFHGTYLGDVARHPLARSGDATDGLVPFHKLSQWLAYSLLEPLEWAGAVVTGLDDLTGLPEYRNGGLFIDAGVLEPIDPPAADVPADPRSELVVEWRALTVVLLDDIAVRVRALLGLDAARLPLAKVLQGGTWTAGRRIAREKRADGAPPLAVATDGTTF
ncbi:MAG: URC4/urg3 family protein [Alphaproteobacteria bacterium]|nr:URC4/urg3 family protein [Alphaproteobacteria bacterium]